MSSEDSGFDPRSRMTNVTKPKQEKFSLSRFGATPHNASIRLSSKFMSDSQSLNSQNGEIKAVKEDKSFKTYAEAAERQPASTGALPAEDDTIPLCKRISVTHVEKANNDPSQQIFETFRILEKRRNSPSNLNIYSKEERNDTCK